MIEDLKFDRNSSSEAATLVLPGISKGDIIVPHLYETHKRHRNNIIGFEWANNSQDTLGACNQIASLLDQEKIRRLRIFGISFGTFVTPKLVSYFEQNQVDVKVLSMANMVGAMTYRDLRPYCQGLGAVAFALNSALQRGVLSPVEARVNLGRFIQQSGGAQRFLEYWATDPGEEYSIPDIPLLAVASVGPKLRFTSLRVPDTMIDNIGAARRLVKQTSRSRLLLTPGEGFWIDETDNVARFPDPNTPSQKHFNIWGSHVTKLTNLPFLAEDIHGFLTSYDLGMRFKAHI
jgi:hypothetical protein